MTKALVTVRSTSRRLPAKCFLPFGEFSVVEHVVKRALHYGLEPIVCTTRDKEDDRILQLASKIGVPCFRGSRINKLQRWRDCCRKFEIEKFHTVDADDPFFDDELVKMSLQKLDEGYDVIAPTVESSSGGASVGYSLTHDIVSRACEGLDDDADTEMMWYFLEKLPGVKKYTLREIDTNIPKFLRLTLDYEEDYWLLASVQRIVGNFASRTEVNQLFIDNPDLYKINWFRNQEWKAGQERKAV